MIGALDNFLFAELIGHKFPESVPTFLVGNSLTGL